MTSEPRDIEYTAHELRTFLKRFAETDPTPHDTAVLGEHLVALAESVAHLAHRVVELTAQLDDLAERVDALSPMQDPH